MTRIDPVIPKLLDLKRRDQEQRLAALAKTMENLKKRQADLASEFAELDNPKDGFTQMSVANGYVRYLQHRQTILDRQILDTQEEMSGLQDDLRQTVFSQSSLTNP